MTYTPSSPGNENVTGYYSSDANNAVSFADDPLSVTGSFGSGFPVLLAASIAVGAIGIAILYAGLRARKKPA